MPVQNQIPLKTYVGNASTTVFPYTFKIINEESLRVFINDVLQTTGYSVSNVGNSAGGNVTFSVAPPNDSEVRLERVTPRERNTDYIEGGDLAAAVLNSDLDNLQMQIQETEAQTLKAIGGEGIDALGRRIINVADPIDDSDVATKGWIFAEENTIVAQAEAHRVAAEMARDVAEEQAEAAMVSAAEALGSMVGAMGFRELAEDYADAAQASADAAFTSESNAAASAADADVSEANAAGSEANAFSYANTASSAATAASISQTFAGVSETNAAASAAAAAASQLAVTSTVANIPGRNKIINGKMEIGQRAINFPAVVTGSYTLDRWSYNGVAGTSVVTVSMQSDVPSDNQFQHSLRAAVTTADTSIAAGEGTFITQPIEGFNARDLIGRTFTLSFRVRSSKTGVHCVAFRNSGTDRSYVAEYTINAANTWETKSITVTGGLLTAGTWSWGIGVGVYLTFALAAGSTFRTMAGAWQTGNFLASTNQVNCLDTVGNIFAITGVQLEVGAVASPFEHRPVGLEISLCQRYCEIVNARLFNVMGWPTVGCEQFIHWKVPKRTVPTVTPQFNSITNVQFGAYSAPGPAGASEIGINSCQMNYGAPATWSGNGTMGRISSTNTGSTDILVNAEL